ncbi:MAG TPA: HNH endonuclease signature motif containing protein [Acidiferrobacterales bacterium]|nr:HNH endonuclease signature motif containing protein [Acidiferrobacterales bacterium]
MNGKPWASEDIALLTREYPDTETAKIAAALGRTIVQTTSKASALGLKKSEKYLASPAACRLRRGDNVGAACRFQKGHVPANKGLRRPGYAPGRMRETQFKNGRKPHTWLPIGSTRLTKEGYLQIKVTDTGYTPNDFKAVHVMLWVEHYGPIPPGYAVGFIDGDKTRVQIGNLVLLSRADLMRRNTYHNNYPKELGELIRIRAQVTRQINKRTRNEKQD